MRRALVTIGLAILLGCGGSGDTGSGGHGGAASSSSSTNTGGAAPTCPQVPCTNPGEACVAGACTLDCRIPGANACAAGTVCDASDASPGKCVDPSAPCVTTSA